MVEKISQIKMSENTDESGGKPIEIWSSPPIHHVPGFNESPLYCYNNEQSFASSSCSLCFATK